MPTIASLKKPELIEAIQNLGEEPPESWGVVELRCRLGELEEMHGILRQRGTVKSPLQQMVVKLNTATKKKSALQAFAQELGITNVGNSTVGQLQKTCLERIYVQTPTSPTDAVGFGEHAHMTYEELREVDPDYCQWVRKMASEGQTCYRLSRLATWLENYQPPKTVKTTMSQTKTAKSKPTSSRPRSQTGSSHSKDANTVAIQETQALVLTLVDAMKDLKGDVETLKEERPHKKKEVSTDSEFSMLSEKNS